MVFPRVIADKDVRPSDLDSSNLILFGTKETNLLIEKFGDRLPIQFNPSAADYGLVYVFPIDGHYVVVSSGLPWWTAPPPPAAGAAPAPANPPMRRGFGFMLGTSSALMGMKDYVLFKGSLADTIAEGSFDPNWRIPGGDAEKMKSTGAVSLPDNAISK
jgi:hypothetical protein